VNAVGVDLNAASRPLLARVSGLGPALAGAIVEHREKQGPFRSRHQLMEVKHLGTKAFEQAAAFLRVRGGEHPLDATGVHPERYAALEALASRLGKGIAELVGPGASLVREAGSLREEMGALTWEDVIAELANPGRDPRGAFSPFSFREDVRTLEELKPGMACPGVVSNVTSFGAFVDIGVYHDASSTSPSSAERPVRTTRPPSSRATASRSGCSRWTSRRSRSRSRCARPSSGGRRRSRSRRIGRRRSPRPGRGRHLQKGPAVP
jgi:uncharacterized protein